MRVNRLVKGREGDALGRARYARDEQLYVFCRRPLNPDDGGALDGLRVGGLREREQVAKDLAAAHQHVCVDLEQDFFCFDHDSLVVGSPGLVAERRREYRCGCRRHRLGGCSG